MEETEIHVIAILHLYEALCRFFRDRQDVYIAADMFPYYEEGNPDARKAPDVMVVKGVDKHLRRTFKTWEEKATPCVIFEITSRSTWVEDMVNKSKLYVSLGVVEYFLFDPLGERLDPPLIGLRLKGQEYEEIAAREDGSMASEELGIWLRVEENVLRVIDPATGEAIPALDEVWQRAAEARQQAEEARQQAEAAEAENARLRALIEQLGAIDDSEGEKSGSSS